MSLKNRSKKNAVAVADQSAPVAPVANGNPQPAPQSVADILGTSAPQPTKRIRDAVAAKMATLPTDPQPAPQSPTFADGSPVIPQAERNPSASGSAPVVAHNPAPSLAITLENLLAGCVADPVPPSPVERLQAWIKENPGATQSAAKQAYDSFVAEAQPVAKPLPTVPTAHAVAPLAVIPSQPAPQSAPVASVAPQPAPQSAPVASVAPQPAPQSAPVADPAAQASAILATVPQSFAPSAPMPTTAILPTDTPEERKFKFLRLNGATVAEASALAFGSGSVATTANGKSKTTATHANGKGGNSQPDYAPVAAKRRLTDGDKEIIRDALREAEVDIYVLDETGTGFVSCGSLSIRESASDGVFIGGELSIPLPTDAGPVFVAQSMGKKGIGEAWFPVTTRIV